MGFAVHVPHYLARAEYPQAARVLLDHVGLAAGLYLPTETVTKAAERTEAEIAEQVAGSDEVRQVVEALEQQYDMVASGNAERSGTGLSGELPSADELAAEVERRLEEAAAFADASPRPAPAEALEDVYLDTCEGMALR
jgi:hypothetical protein